MYTSNTPEEYEPPLFCKATPDDMSWFVDAPLTKTAGNVSTPYHQVSMTVQASKDGWTKEGGSTDAASEQLEVNAPTTKKNQEKAVKPAATSPDSSDDFEDDMSKAKEGCSSPTKSQTEKLPNKQAQSKVTKQREAKKVSKKDNGAASAMRTRGKTAAVASTRKRSARAAASVGGSPTKSTGNGNKARKGSSSKKRPRPDNGESTAGRRLRKTSKGETSLKQDKQA